MNGKILPETRHLKKWMDTVALFHFDETHMNANVVLK